MTATRTDQLRATLEAQPVNGTPAPGTAVAKKTDPAGDLLSSMEDEFRKCLPDILPWDMFARIALTGFRKNPKLLEANRSSLLGALMECARLGLAPCTEQAALSTFKNRSKGTIECQLIVGYQGYVQLMYRSGQVEQVVAEKIYEADEYEVSFGDGGRFFHRPKLLLPPSERGPVILTYAYATFHGGGRTKVEVTPKWKADALKRKHGNVWDSNFEEMWLKTPVRQLQKWAPKSAEMRRAVLADGATFDLGGIVERPDGDDAFVDGEVVDDKPVSGAGAGANGTEADPWAGVEVAKPPVS